MPDVKEMLAELQGVCKDPRAQLDAALARGKKAVGVLPYFCPEELVYACGMLPFGLWGAEMQTSLSGRYFPAFTCSLLHTVLEMGLRGQLAGLSALMVPLCCDSLKCFGPNWKYGVGTVPVIDVAWAQNRKTAAGEEFTRARFRRVLERLEEISGKTVSDGEIAAAIALYNENRAALRAFSAAAAAHPEAVSPGERCAAIKAGYFMDRAEHTAKLRALTAALDALPESRWPGLRVVTTGILADSPALLGILAEQGIAVADDQVAQESGFFRVDTPVTADPVAGLARRLGLLEGCSVLFDPGKERGRELTRLAQAARADGVVWFMTKFCDPEEFDYVPVKRMLEGAGIPLLAVEYDQQTASYEQARSAIEAFAEMLRG
ncbi:MAG: 2-hydroxyacyl-CoA dehydratase [Oscillospiraceae bacterium]|nr:2-hydroxyacyl-CoA dehydratase [Oscillospiraceae bacterium]